MTPSTHSDSEELEDLMFEYGEAYSQYSKDLKSAGVDGRKILAAAKKLEPHATALIQCITKEKTKLLDRIEEAVGELIACDRFCDLLQIKSAINKERDK